MNTAKNISQFALVTLIAAALTSCGKEELVAPEAQYTDMEARMEVGAPVVKQKQMNALGHEDMGRETPEGALIHHRQAYDTTPDKMEFITGEEYLPKEADPIAEPVDAKLEHGSRPPKQDRIHGMEEFGKEPREELMQAIELKFMDAPSAIDTGQDERKEPNEG